MPRAASDDDGIVLRVWLWSIALLVLFVPRLARADVVDVTDAEQDIGDKLELFRDASRTMSAEEVTRAAFTRSTVLHPNFGFTRDAIWVRLTLRNASDRALSLVLDVAREWVEWIDVYDPAALPNKHTTGAHVAVADRPVPVERLAVPIALEVGESKTVLLRLQTRGPLDLLAHLSPERAYMREYVTGSLVFGGYYAVLFGIAAYSLILFFNLRDRRQAFVACVLASYACVEMCGHGHLTRLVPSAAGWFELQGIAIAFAAFNVSLTSLARQLVPEACWITALGWVTGAISLLPALVPGWARWCSPPRSSRAARPSSRACSGSAPVDRTRLTSRWRPQRSSSR